MKTIGFIGVGKLALYTIRGVRGGGYQGPILLSPRNREKAEYLAAQHHCEVQRDNQSVVANSDYIVIATRPAHCLETLASLEFKAAIFSSSVSSYNQIMVKLGSYINALDGNSVITQAKATTGLLMVIPLD